MNADHSLYHLSATSSISSSPIFHTQQLLLQPTYADTTPSYNVHTEQLSALQRTNFI